MDKYQKVKVLGKGSFGSAILIKRKADGLLFVVKEVSLVKMSKKERDEARHECTVLQQLHHPNIVRYVEQFENKTNLYIVMEYCDGGDLAGKVKEARGPMKEPTILYYFSQICLAIEYLHTRHILHRDIKTMNVFLMKNGAVKLGDFGISTVLRSTMGMANTVCGTPYYFSPELCRNRPYNNKSDIWALGVLLYECATSGRHPFDGTSMNQLMQRIVKGNYAPLSSQYSSDFRKIVDWCLQKEPARRPSIKQALAVPLMRRSLEQLEENLMLATQCRVRLKDIIDFESGTDQTEQPKSPQPAQVSPRPTANDGISPGQAAALALAQRPAAQPQSNSPARSPASSPHNNGIAAVVGPKPSAASPSRASYDVHRFYSPYQRKPEANPIVAAERPTGNRAGAQAPPSQPQQPPHQPPPQPSAQISPGAQSPRSNVNLGNGNGAAGGGGAQVPSNGAAANLFHDDMRRVDAIIAKYGKNTDERAKETIHAYMRRKQEAYLKKQKEELEVRERRNELRQRELRRVLENQRAAVSPTNANNQHRNSPQSSDQANGHGARRSPPRGVGSPQSRAEVENASPRSRSPASSPSHAGPVAAAAAAATPAVAGRSPVSPSAPSAFGRDPRRNAGGQQQQPRSRPTTPQRPYAPPGQRVGNAAAVSPKQAGDSPARKVVYAANSPQPDHIERRDGAREARPGTSPTQLRPQSPSRPSGQSAEVVNADWRSLANNAKPTNSPSGRKKASPPAGMDDGIGGHKMILQPAPAAQARRSQDLHVSPAPRDSNNELRRPSALAPLGNEAPNHRSPRHAGQLASNDLLGRGDGAASPASLSPRAAAGGGDPRLQRPNRVQKGYLKPLNERSDDHLSPTTSPTPGLSPRPDALPLPVSHVRGVSPANSPRAQPKAAAKPNAHVPVGRRASPPAELVDIPRSVDMANPLAPASSAAADDPVREALKILRRRGKQTSPSAVSSNADMKDVPALNLVSSELAGGHRQHNRRLVNEGASYVGMSREAVSHDDERFLAEEQRRRKAEENAVPNTLEALRSLREASDEAAAGGASGSSSAEAASPVGHLALLKQRHRMHYNGATNANGAESAPTSASRGPDGARLSAQSDSAARKERRPSTSNSKPPPLASAHVTALSLGDINYAAPYSAPSSRSPKTSKPTTPTAVNAAGGSGGSASSDGGAPHQSSMDGYAEMLQHLKDLLQRRRVTRGVSASNASTPTSGAASPRPDAARNSPLSPSAQRRLPPLPPLDSLPLSEGDSHRTDAAALSPPNFNSTRPLQPLRPVPLALEIVPSSDDQADDDDDDEDFEDAVPLSPVRCAELNDNYVRLQQQKRGGRAVPDDVYTDDVDLTSANMEEELDGEEGYTGYYKLPSPEELLKGA
ncbi:putative protein kinase putativeserine/threonine-protein kinase Nek1 [Leptomonas pyrrhocoris]|uniref:non-specific serine/threonine protein kinase n=1 Tax=Leptomonas pyrrhocoris TaxID=157538 RepID=A0A0N0VH21_LEPPY|nr:putative protein kinase putativeserine/threonine-protein kinase Nek1 [Leptomonas pyrrhocoris]KPA84514.1 putative protein kinase putativeserine/threonine-protein kinase Nek1 [Leptomonas pyrrhocoris]|eukprot:XP_015662953.1 putative protein kinase putativeserine/threonine-protein kinase Nek1 [Leptomonas pyrrhocoris]